MQIRAKIGGKISCDDVTVLQIEHGPSWMEMVLGGVADAVSHTASERLETDSAGQSNRRRVDAASAEHVPQHLRWRERERERVMMHGWREPTRRKSGWHRFFCCLEQISASEALAPETQSASRCVVCRAGRRSGKKLNKSNNPKGGWREPDGQQNPCSIFKVSLGRSFHQMTADGFDVQVEEVSVQCGTCWTVGNAVRVFSHWAWSAGRVQSCSASEMGRENGE